MISWRWGSLLGMAFIFICSSISAQLKTKNGDLYLGPEIRSDKRGTLEDIIGQDKEGYYLIRAEPKEFYLELLDHDLKLVKSEEIELGRGSDRKYLEFAEQIGDEIYLFTSKYRQDIRQKELYSEKIDRSTLKPTGDMIKVASHDYRSRSDDGFYDYHV